MLALILDDSRSSVAHLQRLIGSVAPVDIQACLDADEAIAAAGHRRFDLIVVDHIMPKMDGITVIRQIRALPTNAETPILMITATDRTEVRLAALEAGVTDVILKSCHPLELTNKFRNLLTIAKAVQVLDRRVADLAAEVESALSERSAREEEMIFRLSKAVEFRDSDTGDHTLRVATYSRMIAERLGHDPTFCRRIFLASPLHDVGKVAIPDRILLKPGKLEADEMAVIRTHAEIGARILGGSSCEIVQLAAEIAESHHERWDGSGYPAGLAGTDIPLSARIVAAADVFDALTTERPYKAAFTTDKALAYLIGQKGRQFDPSCVDAMVTVSQDLTRDFQAARP